MAENIPENPPEHLFSLTVEGGRVQFFRQQTAPGHWQFWRESVSMDLDENDDEIWRQHKSQPVGSWDELIQGLWQGWVLASLSPVHPEYRDRLRMATRKEAMQLEDRLKFHWENSFSQKRWREALGLSPDEAI